MRLARSIKIYSDKVRCSHCYNNCLSGQTAIMLTSAKTDSFVTLEQTQRGSNH